VVRPVAYSLGENFVDSDVARITERSRAAEPLSFSDTSDSAVHIFAPGNSFKVALNPIIYIICYVI
jgi:hypothetical protein